MANYNGSVRIATFEVTCKCGAKTIAPAPLGRRTPDGFQIIMRDGHRGWACPACQVLKCVYVDCANARAFTATDFARRQTDDGWRLVNREGSHGWCCATCLTKKIRKGFAVMSPEQQRAIASKGGKKAAANGTKHSWTSEEARAAGRKGGVASHGGRGKNFQRQQHATGAAGAV